MKIQLAVLAALCPVLAQDMPKQADIGAASFHNTSKGTACGTCHSLAGRGNNIAPDLTRLARIPPKAFLTAIKSTMTQYVMLVHLKEEAFPGVKGNEEDGMVTWWDVSKTPPEAKKLKPSDVRKTEANRKWVHPPTNTDYSTQELADIIAYIKWVGYQDRKPVNPEDLE